MNKKFMLLLTLGFATLSVTGCTSTSEPSPITTIEGSAGVLSEDFIVVTEGSGGVLSENDFNETNTLVTIPLTEATQGSTAPQTEVTPSVTPSVPKVGSQRHTEAPTVTLTPTTEPSPPVELKKTANKPTIGMPTNGNTMLTPVVPPVTPTTPVTPITPPVVDNPVTVPPVVPETVKSPLIATKTHYLVYEAYNTGDFTKIAEHKQTHPNDELSSQSLTVLATGEYQLSWVSGDLFLEAKVTDTTEISKLTQFINQILKTV